MHIIVTLFGFSEVFGDGLSSFGNSVFGQLTRKEEATGRLNFSYSDPRSFCLSLRMVSQLGGLANNPLENVVQERIHRRNSLRRDPDVRMDLTKNYAHVGSVFMILLFLTSAASGTSRTASSFLSNLRNHGGGRISTGGLDMSRQCRFDCFR